MKPSRITILLLPLALVVVGAAFLKMQNGEPVELSVRDEGIRGEGGTGRIEGEGALKKYTNSEYGFSFSYPAELKIGQFYDGEGESIVVEDPVSNRASFQLYIAPIEAGVELTPALIQRELPGTVVRNAKKIELDGRAQGILFESNSPAFDGGSVELWFVYGGNVYQATSYPEGAERMTAILGTWRFTSVE